MLVAAAALSRSAFVSPRRRCPGPALASARVLVRRLRADRRGGRDAQHLARGATGRVVEELAQLGEAQLHEPDEPLADPRLLGHERHREAGRLAQLDALEWVAGDGLVVLGHEREAPRIGRVGLRPAQPALGKVLRPRAG